MRCQYCNKKLWLFVSANRPFCSELHEVAYQSELATQGLRRLLDPRFAGQEKRAPVPEPLNTRLMRKASGARFSGERCFPSTKERLA